MIMIMIMVMIIIILIIIIFIVITIISLAFILRHILHLLNLLYFIITPLKQQLVGGVLPPLPRVVVVPRPIVLLRPGKHRRSF